MAKIEITGFKTIDAPAEKRLINAIIDCGADQHYSCGGQARCTTCRVKFLAGEPERMTQAEKDLLATSKLDQEPGIRLSCQILCDHDMTIALISPKPPNKNPARPADEIAPSAVWTTR